MTLSQIGCDHRCISVVYIDMSEHDAHIGEWIRSIWSRLESAPHRPKDPWRLPAMATVSPEGLPEVRHVVLRRANAESRCLEIHSDWASKKTLSLKRTGQVEFCFWNARHLTQVRLSGSGMIKSLDESTSVWSSLSVRTSRIPSAAGPRAGDPRAPCL